jgi:hypothetical protein
MRNSFAAALVLCATVCVGCSSDSKCKTACDKIAECNVGACSLTSECTVQEECIAGCIMNASCEALKGTDAQGNKQLLECQAKCTGQPLDGGADVGPDTMAPDTGPPNCGPGIYPCPPYGTDIGDIADNLEFVGFMDPKNFCKAHEDKEMDLSTKQKIAFASWHVGDPDPTCDPHKRKLLWVMVSAGWCGPCKLEVQSTQVEYAAGKVDPRVGVVNVLFETGTLGEPITEDYLKTWINAYKLTMPVVMDPSFKMGTYFSAKATPFNMLVDTSNMKIYYHQTGGSLSIIGDKIQDFFGGNP